MGVLPNLPSAAASKFTPPKLAIVGNGRIGRAGLGPDELDRMRAEAKAAARAELDGAFAEAQAAKARADRAAGVLLAAAAQIESADRVTLADLREQAIALGLTFAESVVAREIRSFNDVALDTARAALTFIPRQGRVELAVNPEDFASVAAQFEADELVAVVHDSAVSPGGAVVRQGPLLVDADVSAAFARVRSALS
jgi:flagellar biosynthesis/type III secretory pathway protein FliH